MPFETTLATASLLGIGTGIAGCLLSGGWGWRMLLVVCSVVWPFPEHPFEGPVLIKLSESHGIHAADALSLVGLAIAVALPRIAAARDRRRTA